MTDEQTFVGLRLSDRYRVIQLLARGGLSLVYQGQDEPLRRPVAIKAVPPAQVPAYREALRATSALTHPAGVVVLDAIEHDDWLLLIQEYVDSLPLSAELPTGLATNRALQLGHQLTRFLAYAHAHDVIHGDITPPAALLERGGSWRLNNFALPPDRAYFARFAELDELLAQSLHIAVNPDAPATSPDAAVPSAAEDVRAVGLLLWQALASAAPSGEARDFRAEVAIDVRHLVARMIVRAHPRRLTTAAEAVAELAALTPELSMPLEEELQPTPPALHLARQTEPQDLDSSWATADTVVDARGWAPPSSPSAYGPPGGGGAAYDATPTQPAQPAAPMRAPQPSGSLRTAPPSGPLRTAPPTSVLRGGPSGNLPSYGARGPTSQPVDYRPMTPIPWSDDPQVARWAAQGTGRPYGLGPSSRKLRRGRSRPGLSLASVVVIGIVLFALCFAIGYFMPLIVAIR